VLKALMAVAPQSRKHTFDAVKRRLQAILKPPMYQEAI
jgi:hypothetical protein